MRPVILTETFSDCHEPFHCELKFLRKHVVNVGRSFSEYRSCEMGFFSMSLDVRNIEVGHAGRRLAVPSTTQH